MINLDGKNDQSLLREALFYKFHCKGFGNKEVENLCLNNDIEKLDIYA